MGRQDVPLDDVGRQQADGLASALQTAIPARAPLAVHSSPLLRATQTIAPFAAARELRVHLDHALVEMDFGHVAHSAGPRAKLRVKTKHLYDPLPGGESLFQVWRRAVDFFTRVWPALGSGDTVVVVAHYRVSQLLAGVAAGLDFESAVRTIRFKPANASVFEMSFAGGDRPAGPHALWSPPADPGPARTERIEA